MAARVKPINSKQAYEAALKELDRIWGAAPGTPEGDRIDELVTLIEIYEDEHYPMEPGDGAEADNR